MKKILLTLIVCAVFLGTGFSQKIAYVDSDYILSKIPAYESAQKQLDQLSTEWQTEVEGLFAEVDKLYKDYQTEKVLLTEEMRTKRENEVVDKEKRAKDLQKKFFGREGDLYNKRTELVKPIQDNVFNAVKEIGEEGSYIMILDSAGGAAMLYTDPRYDKSEEVLDKLGIEK